MRVLSQITGKPLDEIRLRDLQVDCVIGVYPEEKLRPQALRLDLRLYLDTARAAFSGNLMQTIDYSLIARQLSFILTQARFRLLESAVEALAVFLLNPHDPEAPTLHAVEIEVRKPEALRGVAEPSVRIFRDQDSRGSWIRKGLQSQLLFKVPEASLERWTLPPGESLSIEGHPELSLMCESHGFVRGSETLPAGLVLPLGETVTLHNPSQAPKAILAVTFHGRELREAGRLH